MLRRAPGPRQWQFAMEPGAVHLHEPRSMTPLAPPATPDTELIEPARRREVRIFPQRYGVSNDGMVATAHFEATAAGARILAEGGNAVDAAVAAAFALGACEPAASGLGGQTFMLIYSPETGKTVALDGSSRAPHRVVPGSELPKKQRLHGHRATTVPSTPATLAYALKRFGSRELADVLAPAIELARDGAMFTELQERLTTRELKHLRAGTAGAIYLRDGTKPHTPGTRVQNPALASTFKRIARRGIEDFYQGKIAKAIEADMIAHDGLIRRDDLAQIPWPMERRPVSARFRGMRVLTMPPAGAGRTLLEMLNIAEKLPDKSIDLDTCRGLHTLVEIIRHAFLDRRDRPYEPAYYAQVDDRHMLSEQHAAKLAKAIRKRVSTTGETTHLSVMDKSGMVVSLTQSIERVYGSCAATPELGFIYNNYMSAFEYEDMAHPYYLRPNGVPWASVAPTIVMRGRTPYAAIGSPGSERITSSILQVLLRLSRGQSPLDAVTAPRIHCSVAGKVSLEASRMRSDLPTYFTDRGYDVDCREPFSFYLGCVQLVARYKDGLVGVADPRRDGSASGPDAAAAAKPADLKTASKTAGKATTKPMSGSTSP